MPHDNDSICKLADKLRGMALKMVHLADASHIGGCLSIAEIIALLYGEILNIDPHDPNNPERDRLILSKGHCAAIVYAALAERGFFDPAELDTYCQDGSAFSGHITSHKVPGVEFSTGALGHGLSVGCGIALGLRSRKSKGRVFVIISDGECDEGSIWEAALFGAHHGLDNLTAIIDYNKIQSFGDTNQVLNLEPLGAKWKAFGWEVREVDGHSVSELRDVLNLLPLKGNAPTCIVAHTVKGKGVSYMQNKLLWHYRSPRREEYEQALKELKERE